MQSRVSVIHVAAPNPGFAGYEVGPQHVRDWRAEELNHGCFRIFEGYAENPSFDYWGPHFLTHR